MVRMFMRRAVRKMRQAISPRLATRRLLITRVASLHAEHAKARLLLRGVAHHRERERQYAARVGGVDHPVIPQTRRGVIRGSLPLVLLADRLLEGLLLRFGPLAPSRFELLALHGCEDARRLFPAHHRDARVRPLEQETRSVGAATHGVIAGAIAAADDDGELWHLRTRHRGHEF